MSNLQTSRQHRDRTSSRPGATMLALSMLAAIGLALLILVPNQRPTAPTTVSIAHPASLTAQTTVPASCFRDPTTHALTCSHTAPSPAVNRAPAGYFRDPATHKLQRLSTAPHPARPHPANHSRGRIIP